MGGFQHILFKNAIQHYEGNTRVNYGFIDQKNSTNLQRWKIHKQALSLQLYNRYGTYMTNTFREISVFYRSNRRATEVSELTTYTAFRDLENQKATYKITKRKLSFSAIFIIISSIDTSLSDIFILPRHCANVTVYRTLHSLSCSKMRQQHCVVFLWDEHFCPCLYFAFVTSEFPKCKDRIFILNWETHTFFNLLLKLSLCDWMITSVYSSK